MLAQEPVQITKQAASGAAAVNISRGIAIIDEASSVALSNVFILIVNGNNKFHSCFLVLRLNKVCTVRKKYVTCALL